MTTPTHIPGEFDDLLGAPPSPLAAPAPRLPVTIDGRTGAVVAAAPTNKAVNATAAQLRLNINAILCGLTGEVEGWIRKVAEVSPKAALDIVIELSQFSTPKLKAIAMQIDDNTPGARAARSMTTEELQKMVNE